MRAPSSMGSTMIMETQNLENRIPFLDDNIDDTVDGYVDYKGYALQRSKSGGWRSASFILGAGSLERFAFYGIESNLISYLTGPLRESMATAAANVNTWIGVVALVPVLAAFLADTFLDSYRSIIIFSFVLYILGLGFLTLSTIPTSLMSISNFEGEDRVRVLFYVSLYLVAFAQGYKPCIQAFGADQFDGKHQEESKAKSSFFNWWLCGLCTGAITAHLILHYIQDNVSWGIGFGIPCLAMGVGLVLFLAGNRSYRFSIRVGKLDNENEDGESQSERVHQKSANVTDTSHIGDKDQGALLVNTQKSHGRNKFLNKFLHMEKDDGRDSNAIACTTTKEENKVLKLLPIWLTCLTYTIAYAQSSTLFMKQASTVNRSFGSSLNIPAASLRTFVPLSIFFFIPLYDRVFVPISRRLTKHPSGITMLQRIGIGMAISVLNMIVAALIEKKRLKTAQDFGLVDMPNATIPMSFWWLVPLYILFGLADVFNQVGMQEFFYDQVPKKLRSVGLSLSFGALGIGNFLSSFLIYAIEKATSQHGRDGWFCDNLNHAHLDYFYWFLAGFGVFGLAVFVYHTKSYVYEEK